MTQDRKEKARVVADGIVAYLKNNQFLDLLPEITDLLKKTYGNKINQIQVESAIELSPTEKEQVIKQIQKIYKWQGEIFFSVNKEILGGLKITYGDKIADLSISGKLKRIYENI